MRRGPPAARARGSTGSAARARGPARELRARPSPARTSRRSPRALSAPQRSSPWPLDRSFQTDARAKPARPDARHRKRRRGSTPDGIALHRARVRRRFEDPVLSAGCADAPERPVAGHDHVMAALAQARDDVVTEPALDLDLARLRHARVERTREVVRVERRSVDRLLQVAMPYRVLEEERERPLVLVVTARRSEREVRLAASERERRRQRRSRALA